MMNNKKVKPHFFKVFKAFVPKRIVLRILVCWVSVFSVSSFALEAWQGQQGSDTFEVIFKGDVYANQWWVGATDCPLTGTVDPNNNPWRFQRSATASETARYGNPNDCHLNNGTGDPLAKFDASMQYQQGDKVDYQSQAYQANRGVAAYSFTPNQANPWKVYKPLEQWSDQKTYRAGEQVYIGNYAYESLFWNQHSEPSDQANQNPAKTNSKPWFPLGDWHNLSQDDLERAPSFDNNETYYQGDLVRFNSQFYTASQQVFSVVPNAKTPWKIFIDWSDIKQRIGVAGAWPKQVFSPYVDMTLWNNVPDFSTLAATQGINHFTTAFIVAKDANSCIPTWGASYSMADFTGYSNIKKLRDAGGDIMLSIGGANNTPLSAACKDPDDLSQMYINLVDHLNLNALDFDIEGGWVADKNSIKRRSTALAEAQVQWRQAHKALSVWITLPVLPSGITADGINVIQSMKQHRVELSGVNLMTMDYGDGVVCPLSKSKEGENIQAQCGIDALNSAFTQLTSIFTEKSAAQIWSMMGTTPMIGVNDNTNEVFYVSDAQAVAEHASKHHLGLVAMWSMARDKPGEKDNASPTASGLTQVQAGPFDFSHALTLEAVNR